MNLQADKLPSPTVSESTEASALSQKKRRSPPHTSPAAVAPAPIVASITDLTNRLSEYLSPSDLKLVKEAYRFSDEMHLGQVRKSGEPYISHPIAVAEICAEWKLDVQAIMAALLHDVMEDQDVKKEELIERFGAPVAALVDGLSKLEKSNSKATSKRKQKTSVRCYWLWREMYASFWSNLPIACTICVRSA